MTVRKNYTKTLFHLTMLHVHTTIHCFENWVLKVFGLNPVSFILNTVMYLLHRINNLHQKSIQMYIYRNIPKLVIFITFYHFVSNIYFSKLIIPFFLETFVRSLFFYNYLFSLCDKSIQIYFIPKIAKIQIFFSNFYFLSVFYKWIKLVKSVRKERGKVPRDAPLQKPY
jgi:hypothetical protein